MESLNEMSWSSESVEATARSSSSTITDGTMFELCMAKAIECNQQMAASCIPGNNYDAFYEGCDYC